MEVRSPSSARRRSRAVTVFAVVALLSLSRPASAQEWYKEYDDGLAAFGKQQWAAAEQKFKAALQKRSGQGRRVLFYGTRREDYLPEFYLAQVYLNTGRTKEGADLLARVERAGLIKSGDKEYSELTRLARAAQDRLAAERIADTRPPSDPNAGRRGGGNPPGGGGNPPGGATEDPAARAERERRDELTRLLNQANTQLGSRRLADAKASLDAARARATPADRQAIDDLARKIQIGDLQQGVETAIGRKEWTIARRAVDALERLDPSNRAVAGFRGTIAAGERAVDVANAERNVMLAYFDGNYSRALQLLGADPLRSNPTPRTFFYRACSNAALALLEGEKGASRLAPARADYARVRGDRRLRDDRQYVSPAILDALERSGGRRGGTAPGQP